MIKVLFKTPELLFLFIYPLSQKYPIKFHERYDDFNNCWTVGNFLFIFQRELTSKLVNTIDVLVEDFCILWPEVPYDDTDKFTNRFIKTGKPVFCVDNHNEHLPMVTGGSSHLIGKLEKNDNLYFINSRNYYKNTDRSIQNLRYLQLFAPFFWSNDIPHVFPKLPSVNTTDQPYDFISYVGIDKELSGDRLHVIKRIESETNLSVYRCQSFSGDRNYAQKEIQKYYTYVNNLGVFRYFSEYESLQAKVKLRFESVDCRNLHDDHVSFFTEKTMSCFMSSHPYFLFISEYQKMYLKSIGFKLPGPDNAEKYIDYVIDICKNDLDDWIDRNKHTFEHNKNHMYDMLFDYNLPHIKFFEDILQ